MNSSASPGRKIASNLLWTPQGLLRDPLVTVSAEGRLLAAESCPAPDRTPFTEFYAGLLVPDFPADYLAAFARMQTDAATPLPEQLRLLIPAPGGVLVLFSGLDYDTLRLTPQTQLRRIG